MKFQLFFLLLTTLIFTVACGDDTIPYNEARASFDNKKITVQASLTAIPKEGALRLTYTINNESDSTLNGNTFQAELKSPEGLMNLPQSAGKLFAILPGKTARGTLLYNPVNSAYLFQRIGLKGPLLRKYHLKLSFISKKGDRKPFTGKLAFSMSPDAYKSYLKTVGGAITLYKPSFDFEAFRAAHLAYYKKNHKPNPHAHHKEPPPAMMISGVEVMLQKMILKMAPYRKGDTLFLYMKLINRGDPIQIDTGRIIMTCGKKRVTAAGETLTTKSREPKKGLKIKLDRNGRLINHFKMGGVKNCKTLRLSLPGLLDNKGKPFFIRDFVYSEMVSR